MATRDVNRMMRRWYNTMTGEGVPRGAISSTQLDPVVDVQALPGVTVVDVEWVDETGESVSTEELPLDAPLTQEDDPPMTVEDYLDMPTTVRTALLTSLIAAYGGYLIA